MDFKNSLKTAVTAIGLLCAALLFSAEAQAVPIANTSFGITGGFTVPSGTHLGNTDAIFMTNGGLISVTSPDMLDLAGIVNFGDTGTLQDIPSISSFSSISGYISLSNGVSVDLNSLNLWAQIGPTPGFINLYGDAVIHAPGFDATAGVITITGTSSDNQSFAIGVTTSAQAPLVAPVPEPISIALVGFGMLAAWQVSRRRNANGDMI
jgi:hypothetical protein